MARQPPRRFPAPPPTKFGPKPAQPRPASAAPRSVPPPPTKYGPRASAGASLQPAGPVHAARRGPRPLVVQRSEKEEGTYWERGPKKRTDLKLARYTGSADSKGRTRRAKKRQELGKTARTEDVALLRAQAVPPGKDRRNRKLQNGKRPGWYTGFTEAYWKAHGDDLESCVKYDDQNPQCSGKMQIDHIDGWREEIWRECEQITICDGKYHWSAYLLDDSQDHTHPIHRPPDEDTEVGARTAVHHEENLQPMCAHHNAQKNGSKDLDLEQPEFVGACPDPDNCDL